MCPPPTGPGSLKRVSDNQPLGPTDDRDLPEQTRVRMAKREALLAEGRDPYPVGYPRTATIAEIRARYEGLPPDTSTGDEVAVAGRVMLSRVGGKLCFATIRDGTGDLQVMVSLARVGEQQLAAWKRDVDLGDQIGVHGEVITSRSGELSVLADSFAIISKSLRPLPEKHKGLSDVESRVRQRYVDLIINPEARRMARLRSDVAWSLRDQMHDRGFMEVETPVLQAIHGGANARPFITHVQRLRQRAVPADRARAVPEAADRGRDREASSRSAGCSATRAWTPPTTPSSPCSRRTRPTATTTRWPR